MARQLAFDLPARVALGRAAFFVSDANRAAHDMISGAAPWPGGKLALTGPPGSGKSHLLRVWQEGTGAALLRAPDLGPDVALPAPGARIAIDDADRLPAEAEEALFHLHNHLAGTGGLLLLAARRPPARWPTALPDLASRLQATPLARIDDPDDRLLAAVIAKQFHDRQIIPTPDLIPYLVARIERSFAAAAAVVDRIDRHALAERRSISRHTAAMVLDKP